MAPVTYVEVSQAGRFRSLGVCSVLREKSSMGIRQEKCPDFEIESPWVQTQVLACHSGFASW